VSLLFLLAYTCSGLAGLIYEVSWTRLLTLYIGHSTAAASAVVAAFLGGLAVGAAFGGVVASRLAPRQNLQAYIGLELFVALFALLLPFELRALTPLLRWAYADAAPESELALLDLPTLGTTSHNGGALHFGPDGYLYVSLGDDGPPPKDGSWRRDQMLDKGLFGGILRIDVDKTFVPAKMPAGGAKFAAAAGM